MVRKTIAQIVQNAKLTGLQSMTQTTAAKIPSAPLARAARCQNEGASWKNFASLFCMPSNDQVERPATMTAPRTDAAHHASRSAPTRC